MGRLKYLLPFVLVPLVAVAGFVIWRALEKKVVGNEADRQLIWSGPPPGLAPLLDRLDEGGRNAFDFARAHYTYPQEWWYFNVHLMDEEHRRYALMFALLKTGQVLGSLSLVHHQKHFGLHLNGPVELAPFTRTVTAPSCELVQTDPDRLEYEFRFGHKLAQIVLKLHANKPPLPVGGEGLINMGEGGESYYYSLTNMSVEGHGRILKTMQTLTGKGWLDHQWGDWNDRDFDQWRWYSIQLANNVEIMIFEFRRSSRKVSVICDVVMPDGSTRHGLQYEIIPQKTWISPDTGRNWALGWQVRIPEIDTDLMVLPDMDDQEVTVSLWEGVCKVEGKFAGQPTRGLAFYEARNRTW
jgi:predicted secreted hydrolase